MPSLNLKTFTLLLGIAFVAHPSWAADAASFQRSANGVSLQKSSGAMFVTVCSDTVIHIVVSPTKDIPESDVPVVIGACGRAPFELSSTEENVTIRTSSLKVSIDRTSFAVRFVNKTGQLVLAEQSDGRELKPIQLDEGHFYEA